jgi:hypothetical protein
MQHLVSFSIGSVSVCCSWFRNCSMLDGWWLTYSRYHALLQRTQVSECQKVNWPGQMLCWADFGFALWSPLATTCCLRRRKSSSPSVSFSATSWLIFFIDASSECHTVILIDVRHIIEPALKSNPPSIICHHFFFLMDNVVTFLLTLFPVG